MKLLTRLQNPRLVQALADYLSVQGYAVQIKTEEGEGQIWLTDDSQFDAAQAEVERFIADPANPRYMSASWERNDTAPTSFSYRNSGLIQKRFFEHAGIVTLSTFVICWALFLLRPFIGYDGLYFPSEFPKVSGIEWLNVLSPAFIHFSMVHIVFNTIWWWYLGGMVEQNISKTTLLSILVICGVTGNVAQFSHTGIGFGGLSGVVYGLTGFVWLTGVLSPQRNIMLPTAMFVFMLVWMALGMFDMLMVSVANSAHFVGLISGLVLAMIFSMGTKKPV